MRKASSDSSGQLLQELEALSQALQKSQLVLPSSSNPAPRREFDQVGARRRVSEAVGRPKSVVQSSQARHSISELIPKNRKNITNNLTEEEEEESQEQDEQAVESSREWSLNEEHDLSERLLEHKKSGFWNWKPLRALAHIRQQRFNCEFSAHVHGIDKLPTSMNGLRLKVQLKHRDADVQTMPARISHGCAEFDELLQFRCTVYGSKKSSGVIKFVSKSFTLAVVATDVEELDFGKHELDLSRILPSNYSAGASGAAKDSSSSSSAWNTSFKLSGKAKGACLWITFGYEILDKGSSKSIGNSNFRSSSSAAVLRSYNSLPSSPQIHQPKDHGVKHRKASSVVDFGSPAMSEPGNDLQQDFPMEHFSLDDESHRHEQKQQPTTSAAQAVSDSINSGSATKKLSASFLDFDRRGRSLFPEIDPVIAPETPGRNQEQDDREESAAADAEEIEEVADDQEDEDEGMDDAEFNVVDQGTETSPLSGDFQNEEAEGSNSIGYSHEEEGGSVNLDDQAQEDEEEEEDLEQEQADEEQEDDQEEQGYEPEAQKFEVDRFEWEEETKASTNNLDELEEDDDREEDGLDAAKDLLKSDDEAEIVTGEFLEMLDAKQQTEDDDEEEEESQGADSPRALLLRQFEQEAMIEGGLIGLEELDSAEESQDPRAMNSLNKIDVQDDSQRLPELQSDEWNSDEDNELAAIMDAAESELQKATQAMKSKARAKMLEDAEAEALLQEWGLDEHVFRDEEQEEFSQEHLAAATSSEELFPAKLVRQQQIDLPALAPGLGPSVPTADGGSLRSMDPANFRGGKNDGKLVMHVSKPVVVPADMGFSAIDVLRNLAAAGTDRMAAQAMEAMPLEDITGKSVQQIALEGQACFEENSRRYDAALLASSTNRLAIEDGDGGAQNFALLKRDSSSAMVDRARKQPIRSAGGEFLSLDELAPVAMEKIEELAMQGLKIQCDMAEEDAPYIIEAAQSSPLLIRGGSNAKNPNLLEGPSDQASCSSSDELISMSLSLDEWMRLDAGLDDEEQTDEKTKAIMAAHRAAHTTTDLVLNLSGESNSIDPGKEGSSAPKSFGKMGDTLTLAMLVQLRDPLRNYEPVGAPMMALVEAERVMVSAPRPKLWKRIGLKGNSEADYQEQDRDREEEDPAEEIKQPQFKITGVHMAGLNVSEDSSSAASRDPKKKQQQPNLWGNQRQQQSGSRWLIANGMGKNTNAASKHPLLKSKPKSKQSDSVWSISSRLESNSGVSRNPDVKFGARSQLGGAKRRS